MVVCLSNHYYLVPTKQTSLSLLSHHHLANGTVGLSASPFSFHLNLSIDSLLSSSFSQPQAAAMPPPINWRTKPNLHQQCSQDNSGLDTSQHSNAATNGRVAVYISPARLRDIEAALQYLGLPPLSDLGNDPDQATPHHDNINHPTSPQFERFDNPAFPQPEYCQAATPIGRYSPQGSSDYSDLSASFSRLSTLTTSTSSAQVPSASFQSNSSPRKNLKKYYVITVGKCTGVFWDEW